jgi:beta-1,4-mannosyl-glycoprotein beta-1,4-N-acetylglucosaminyltransferase
MIYDCFTFFNEFDILDIRLHEMDPWVDRFVLVESGETFSGNPKPLWFLRNRHRFEAFLPKIDHLVAPLRRKGTNPWERQSLQRSFAMKVLDNCADGDLILISDVDEIIMGMDFAETQGDEKGMTTFYLKNYFYYMNLLRGGGWPGPVMMSYGTLKSDYDSSLWEARRLRRRCDQRIKKGGWHFSNMGGKDAVLLKIQSSCHYDISSYKKMATDEDFLYDLMEGKRTIKGRKMRVVPIDDSYPIWFKNNLEKFKHLLTKEN